MGKEREGVKEKRQIKWSKARQTKEKGGEKEMAEVTRGSAAGRP